MIIGMSWPRIVDEQYQGDPFRKLIECDGKQYVLDEASLIEQQVASDQAFIDSMRQRSEESIRDMLARYRRSSYLSYFTRVR